jgi:hypothetical protein
VATVTEQAFPGDGEIITQMEELGIAPDHRIHALSELPALVAARES